MPAFATVEPLQAGLERFASTYARVDREHAAGKFGLREFTEADAPLQQQLHELLQEAEVDMTLFYRGLADLDLEQPSISPLQAAFYDIDKLREHQPAIEAWLRDYAARASRDALPPAARRARMNAVNPRYVLRNYLAQQAIDRAEAGDDAGIHDLLEVMRQPYVEQPGREAFAARRPDWARDRAGCSMLSCSS